MQSLDDPPPAVRGPQHHRDPPANPRRPVGHLRRRRPAPSRGCFAPRAATGPPRCATSPPNSG
jgi:hypothetical protein